jgi:hypothetical protein
VDIRFAGESAVPQFSPTSSGKKPSRSWQDIAQEITETNSPEKILQLSTELNEVFRQEAQLDEDKLRSLGKPHREK